MNGQLYLFPELAPQEKDAKTKGGRKAPQQTDLPKHLTVDDFVKSPNGGFLKDVKPVEICCNGCTAPIEYTFPFIRQYAPTHTKAMAAYRNRLEELRRLLIEEYVRLHAQAEKDHPEWFVGGASVDPDNCILIPFSYSYFDSKGEGILESHSYGMDYRMGIPFSVCAGLVKELDLHYPTYRVGNVMNLATLTPCVRMHHSTSPTTGKPLLILYTGDISQTKSDLNDKFRFITNRFDFVPVILPEPFRTLSRLYARESMTLTKKTLSYHTTMRDTFYFRLYAATEEEREKEQEELQVAVKTGLDTWNGFVSENMKALAVQAKRNLEIDEQRLMELIHSGEEKR